ncbi:PWWP domain-containing protein2 [Smittium culicis]|uniref:PWWP domain-containing protein2 n=1 Tax=Smittium culicis TaxID=133412 RepID=A0A1R1X010_9FUNG|nr:PWWP domain-containing protein2 [Smittium culicis]OMJ14520.1 PWWP domain-containing protein2 [Smittium culicis]
MVLEDHSIGTVCWAKLKGFPWWPAVIMEESILSVEVMKSKPRFGLSYPVMFLGSIDFAWLTSENLEPYKENLERHSIKTKNRKEPKFGLALKQAEDPQEISKLVDLIARETEEEREFLKNGGHVSRSSSDDNSDSENDSDAPKPRKSPKPKSTPAKRRDSASANTPNKKSKPTPSRSNKKPSSKSDIDSSRKTPSAENNTAPNSSENIPNATEKDSSPTNDENKQKSGKVYDTLMFLRHRIQRSLLKSDKPAQTTKMGKLMRRVSILENIPDEDEQKYKIKSRAFDMTSKWRQLVPHRRPSEDPATPNLHPTENDEKSDKSPKPDLSTNLESKQNSILPAKPESDTTSTDNPETQVSPPATTEPAQNNENITDIPMDVDLPTSKSNISVDHLPSDSTLKDSQNTDSPDNKDQKIENQTVTKDESLDSTNAPTTDADTNNPPSDTTSPEKEESSTKPISENIPTPSEAKSTSDNTTSETTSAPVSAADNS